MNIKNSNNPFKVVISIGDESGIGPEIILKALFSNEIPKNVDFLLVGSKKSLQNSFTKLRALGLENLANPNNLRIHDMDIASSDKKSKSNYGDSSFNYLTKAIEIVKRYPNSALVTAQFVRKHGL